MFLSKASRFSVNLPQVDDEFQLLQRVWIFVNFYIFDWFIICYSFLFQCLCLAIVSVCGLSGKNKKQKNPNDSNDCKIMLQQNESEERVNTFWIHNMLFQDVTILSNQSFFHHSPRKRLKAKGTQWYVWDEGGVSECKPTSSGAMAISAKGGFHNRNYSAAIKASFIVQSHGDTLRSFCCIVSSWFVRLYSFGLTTRCAKQDEEVPCSWFIGGPMPLG